jgi:hypothetical protein
LINIDKPIGFNAAFQTSAGGFQGKHEICDSLEVDLAGAFRVLARALLTPQYMV